MDESIVKIRFSWAGWCSVVYIVNHCAGLLYGAFYLSSRLTHTLSYLMWIYLDCYWLWFKFWFYPYRQSDIRAEGQVPTSSLHTQSFLLAVDSLVPTENCWGWGLLWLSISNVIWASQSDIQFSFIVIWTNQCYSTIQQSCHKLLWWLRDRLDQVKLGATY